MENQNGWKRPLMVAGIGLVVCLFIILFIDSHVNAFNIGLAILFQTMISFVIGIGQLFFLKTQKDALKQLLMSLILLLIGFGVCSQGSLNIH
jgi:hypothetical protein